MTEHKTVRVNSLWRLRPFKRASCSRWWSAVVLMGALALTLTQTLRRDWHSNLDLLACRESVLSVSHALYINLERRLDRKNSIERQLSSADIPFHAVQAVDVSNDAALLRKCWGNSSIDLGRCAGQIGCKYSHIEALERAVLLSWETVAIFEDDFVWNNHTNPKLVQGAIRQIIQAVGNWDVIAISLNIIKHEPLINVSDIRIGENQWASVTKIYDAQTTHGYFVRRGYISKILRAFENCDVQRGYWTAIDTCWKSLQRADNWFGLDPQLGTQAPGFSDIEKQSVAYDI